VARETVLPHETRAAHLHPGRAICYTPSSLGAIARRKLWRERMANTKTAIKRDRTNERDRQKNIAVKSRMKTFVKQAMTDIEKKDAEAMKTSLPVALSEIDKASSQGVIHANSAARKKSTLQRLAGK
jgi:small subunit ribosomal protein S20